MIPKIYDKNHNYIGELPFCTRGLVIEERNGMFELELDYRLFHQNYEYLVRGNIIEVDANDKQKNQLFRIYKVTKDIMGQFSVYANHISYDIARDYTDGFNITNQSCEYCLNQLFRNSQFSQKFVGYSDIVNAQNYAIGPTNLMLAIAGSSGSIIDTFGTGAEILRDNYDFHVLNKRGQENGVVIEYASNLTGLDYEEDDTSLITRIRAIAKYTPEVEEGQESEEQIIVTYVDSPLINEYETPFIGEVDFSERFEDGEVPTVSKLQTLGREYFNKNQCDVVKFSYKVSFIPLSKCVGYEGIEDRIDLCDTVQIIDERYGLNTKAKVIKVTYDFLRDRYDSMELGEPRTSLGDIVGGNTEEPPAGPQGPKGEKGEDGKAEDFPDTLPTTPILNCKLYGFASIEISWTFENKPYYTYELFASKEKGFTPNEFDLIHEGQSSSFLFQARPSETWYFRVCGKNSYGNRTSFSEEVEITTTKVADLSNYVGEMAIGEALIGELSLDRGWVGQLNASLLDVKGNFSVTDGNGKRTLDIDSFGNVYLDVSQLQINSSTVPTKDDVERSIASIKIDSEKIDFLVEKGSTSSNMKLTAEAIKLISDNIDLTGKVTFNSLGGNLKDQVNTTTDIIDNWVYTDVETQTTMIDGGKIKTGSITAEKIAVGALAVDHLKSNNENPIIKLFSECSIDATDKDGKGQGKVIRLKWDDYNYIAIGEDKIEHFLSGGGEEKPVLTISGDTSDAYLSNYDGTGVLMISKDEAYYNDELILTTKNAEEQLDGIFAKPEYVDEAIESVNEYIDNSINDVNEYIDNSINDMNEYIDSSINDLTEYVDDAIANLEETINNLEPGDGSGDGSGDGGSMLDGVIEYVEQENSTMYLGTSWVQVNNDLNVDGHVVMSGNLIGAEALENIGFITFADGTVLDSANGVGGSSSGYNPNAGWWDGTGSPAEGSGSILGKYNLGGPIVASQFSPNIQKDQYETVVAFSKGTMKNPLFSVNGDMVIAGHLGIIGYWSCNGTTYSDKRTKENIRFITDTDTDTDTDTLVVEKENLDARDYSKEELIVNDDLYDFIVNQIKLCEYDYIIDETHRPKIGFIANDYEGTKVGDKIVFKDEEVSDFLGFDQSNLLFATIGALQEEVRIRDKQIHELESRMELLENKLNELLNKGQD